MSKVGLFSQNVKVGVRNSINQRKNKEETKFWFKFCNRDLNRVEDEQLSRKKASVRSAEATQVDDFIGQF